MSQSNQCIMCKHFQLIGCDAFPERIPVEIITGHFDHHNPYPGDNGIRFEARE